MITADLTTLPGRLAAFRKEVARAGVDAYILPSTDEFLSEFTPPHARRLEWLTGFTGSAGMVVVTAEQAAFFTDGRYMLQAAQQLPKDYEIINFSDRLPVRWLLEQKKDIRAIGYDPMLFSGQKIAAMETLLEGAPLKLKPLTKNLVDKLWKQNRPEAPRAPVEIQAMHHAGESAHAKRARVCAAMQEEGVGALFLAAPEDIAWLLNIRAMDVPHTPSPLCRALLLRDEAYPEGFVRLFIEECRINAEMREHLGARTEIAAPDTLLEAFERTGFEKRLLWLDPAACPQAYVQACEEKGVTTLYDETPIALMKACKNAVEIAGAQAAHTRDGVALARALCWLDATAHKGNLTELDVVAQVRACRARAPEFVDDSFDTIAGYGANGAIVHYRPTEETTLPLKPGNLLLLDSGGQYRDGTTDVTRTIAIGEPTQEQREAFTRVLKGHIALARAVFPEGTTGTHLDALARYALWQAGMDYDHGTGHGVGSFLSVHEGPQRISRAGSGVALREGMILSNEPGFYKTGAFGIRLENLVVVVKADMTGTKPFYRFDTLTLAPLDRRLIAVPMLADEERYWVDEYHTRVRTILSPALSAEEQAWLNAATAPLPPLSQATRA